MYPKDLLYTKEHEWAKVENGNVIFGITFYAQEQLGDIVFIELPKTGTVIAKSSPCGVIESVKAVSELYAPVSGEVISVNEKLTEHPELINSDPYGEGWMVKVKLTAEMPKELMPKELMNVSDYQTIIGVNP